MTTADTVLETLIGVDNHVRRLVASTRVDEVISAANAYLASWPSVRIRNLQKVDGGWGPFDFRGQPKPIHGVAEISRISDSLRRQCSALTEASIDPTPELLELDLFFALAKGAVQTILPARTRTGTSPSRATYYSHWSDQDSAAA